MHEESGSFLASALARMAVCEKPRFLLFEGDDGSGTKTEPCNSAGHDAIIRSATRGLRLVNPFSLMPLMISPDSLLYSEKANPCTSKTFIEVSCVPKEYLQPVQSGEPNLSQSTQGVGKSRSRSFDTTEVSIENSSYENYFVEMLKTKPCPQQVEAEIQNQ